MAHFVILLLIHETEWKVRPKITLGPSVLPQPGIVPVLVMMAMDDLNVLVVFWGQ